MLWRQEDLEFLKNNYPLHGGLFCAEKLSRTNKSVRNKASSLGLKSPNNKTKTLEQYNEELFFKEIDCIATEEYINNATAIAHLGFCGHSWKATPNRILSGTGCPECASRGFNKNDSAILYLVSLIFEGDKYYKLGVTNNSPRNRYLSEWLKLQMEEVWSINYELGSHALQKEKEVGSKFSKFRALITPLVNGNTEIFTVFLEKPEC